MNLFENVFFSKLFDRLRSENPDFTDLIKIIDSNLEDSSMGLTTADRDWIVENVNFVFHCAATIKFNETFESASKINIQGTEKLLSLATQMKKLKVIYYKSTSYSLYRLYTLCTARELLSGATRIFSKGCSPVAYLVFLQISDD